MKAVISYEDVVKALQAVETRNNGQSATIQEIYKELDSKGSLTTINKFVSQYREEQIKKQQDEQLLSKDVWDLVKSNAIELVKIIDARHDQQIADQNERHTKQVEELDKIGQEYLLQITQQQEQIKTLEVQLKNATETIKNIEQEKQTLETDNKKLSEQLKAEQSKFNEISTKLNQAEEEHKKDQKTLSELKNLHSETVSALKSESSTKDKTINTLQTQVEKLTELLKPLTELKLLVEKLDKENLTANDLNSIKEQIVSSFKEFNKTKPTATKVAKKAKATKTVPEKTVKAKN